MARMPNPSLVPLVGPGGLITPEWVRYLQGRDDAAAQAAAASPAAPAPAPSPAPDPGPATAAALGALGASVAALEQDPFVDASRIDDLAERVSALEQGAP